MNTYLISFQYQGDDRCENHYRAYCKTDDEEEVEQKILSLPNCSSLENRCKFDYQEYFEGDEDYDENDNWVGLAVEKVNDKDYINTDWFNNLICLIDENMDS